MYHLKCDSDENAKKEQLALVVQGWKNGEAEGRPSFFTLESTVSVGDRLERPYRIRLNFASSLNT